eukprot:9571501-Prorocentrum_lima.AAC.1
MTKICSTLTLLKPGNCCLCAVGLGLNRTKVHEACQDAQNMVHAFRSDNRQVGVENQCLDRTVGMFQTDRP